MNPVVKRRIVKEKFFRIGKLEILVDGNVKESLEVLKGGGYKFRGDSKIFQKGHYAMSIMEIKRMAKEKARKEYGSDNVEVRYHPNSLKTINQSYN